MACFHPLRALRKADGSIQVLDASAQIYHFLLPCGNCVGCRLERSRQWAVRILHESKLYKHNWFLTLTYDDKHMPTDGSLHYRDFQLFFKRLRKHYGPTKLRFFMCGEYGENFDRPHYHACVFNLQLDDLQRWKKSGSGGYLYRSPTIERLWPYGFSTVGELNFNTAAYTARYVVKKVNGGLKDAGHYQTINYATGEITEKSPEFAHMSLKPGIGKGWYEKYRDDYYPSDMCVVNGVPCKPPRYYDKQYRAAFPDAFDVIQLARLEKLHDKLEDFTSDRLIVRETVQKAKLALKQRTL